MGANDCRQLANLNECARQKVLEFHTGNGVFIPCADGIIIGNDVAIGDGSVIMPNTIIKGKTVIGRGCTIGPSTMIINSKIGEGSSVEMSYCKNSVLRNNSFVGPLEKIVDLRDHSESGAL